MSNDVMTKLITAIAVLLDAKQSLEIYQCAYDGNGRKPEVGYQVCKSDSAQSISRRLVFVREKLNEVNKDLKGD